VFAKTRDINRMTAAETSFGANAAEEEAQGRQIATSLKHLANASVQKNATIDQLRLINLKGAIVDLAGTFDGRNFGLKTC
jgi:hypothetical protein